MIEALPPVMALLAVAASQPPDFCRARITAERTAQRRALIIDR